MTLQQRVAAALEKREMMSRGSRIGVAVSGGADSVFLLHALGELGLAAAVIHINHGLRAAESDGDEAFVNQLAARLGLPFHVLRETVAPGNPEQEARRARYGFFSETIAAGHCDSVATGHTLDDQAETVLSRFLRGSGTAGLSGIHAVTEAGIIRPLLGLRRLELREWLIGGNLQWREDRSNNDVAFLRNRLRLNVMPELLTLNPALPQSLAAMAEWAAAEEAYWVEETTRLESEFLRRDREAVLIELEGFSRLALAVRRRLLRRGIERVRGTLRGIEFRHVEAIRELMNSREGSGRLQLPDLDIYRSFDWLRFAPVGYDSRLERNFETHLTVPGFTALPERRLAMEMELVTRAHVYNEQVDALDFRVCSGSLVLRNWQPGDYYLPVTQSAGKKIKTLFQEYRIPLWERRHWPVIALGDSIVWSRHFGVARKYAAGPESDIVLTVRETGESKAVFQASVTSVGRELKRAGSRPEAFVAGRSAEAS